MGSVSTDLLRQNWYFLRALLFLLCRGRIWSTKEKNSTPSTRQHQVAVRPWTDSPLSGSQTRPAGVTSGMENGRKRVKTDADPPVSHQATIPESPIRRDNIQVPASSPTLPQEAASRDEVKPTTNANGKRPGSASAPVTDYDTQSQKVKKTTNGANASQIVPSVPNGAIRKAGFPSQQRLQTKVQQSAIPPQRTGSQTSNSPSPMPYSPHAPTPTNGASSSAQQMRQHVQAYQYNPNSPQPQQVRSPQGYPQSMQGMQYQGYPQGQSAQQFYGPPNGQYQMTAQQMQQYHIQQAQMAAQFSPGQRPLQRLVQRPDGRQSPGTTQYQSQPQQYSPYQAGPGQGYPQNMARPGTYGGSNPYQRPGHSAQQQPAIHIDPAALAKVSEVFPHLPDAIIRKALLQARGNADDAQALLADDKVRLDMSDNQAPPQQIYQVPHGYHPNMNGGMQQPQRHLPVSTKREIKAPNLSVREKQALRTAQTYPGQFQPQQQQGYPNPYIYQQQHQQQRHQQQQQQQLQMLRMPQYQRTQQQRPAAHIPAVYEPPKLRTRAAKKGPKIEMGSDESEDDAVVELDSEGQDESEGDSEDDDQEAPVAVYLDFDRVALESRVLHYLNTVATAKEFADLASCTEETATFVMQSRPFSDLDTVRALDQLPEGKRPSRGRKTVGTKVVDMSIDAMEGYEAIDSLVDRCTEYGVAVREAIAEWGIDVNKADDKDGAIDIVKIDAEAAASKAATISYLKDQPTLLPETVRLKDYQL